MKLSSDYLVLRLAHGGITNFTSLSDFYKKGIENFISVCKKRIPDVKADASNSIVAEHSVSGASISSVSVNRLITAVNAANHYSSITRAMIPQNMGYVSVLATFKIKCEACLSIKDHDDSKVPKINDKEKDWKIIL